MFHADKVIFMMQHLTAHDHDSGLLDWVGWITCLKKPCNPLLNDIQKIPI